MRSCVQLVQFLVAFESASHFAIPANFCLVLTFSYPFHSPHARTTRACSTQGQPVSSYKPCIPHVLLCSPLHACQSCLSDAWCAFLLPSRAYAIRVCPTLGCSLSWIPHLGRINARCEAVSSLCRFFWHSCLLCSVLATPAVPAMRVCPPLLYPSLAFPTSFCDLCLRKVSCALPQHVMPLIMSFSCLSHELLPSVSACALLQHAISPSLPLASMCAVYNIPSRTHTEPAPQCRAPGPDKQLCVAVSSSCRCFQHSCLRHTWRPPQLLPWPSLFWRFEFQINATKCEAVCSLCRCF